MQDPLIAPLAADLDRLAALGPSDAPVPACGDWTLADLLGHVGTVARFAAACLTTEDPTDRPKRVRPVDGDDLGEWVRGGRAELLGALEATPADRPVTTFVGPAPARWWLVRQASEMAVHRVDAERAAGVPVGPVDPALAAAAVDEWFELVCGVWKRDALVGRTLTLHLHATGPDDAPAGTAAEWTARWGGDDGYTWGHDHAKGELALRGDRGDLLLVLWGREPVGPVEVLGDAALLAELQALTAI